MAIVYVDTSALPQYGSLDTLVFSAVRAIARAQSIRIAAPSLVVDESVAKVRREYRKAVDKFRKSRADLERFIDLLPLQALTEEEDVAAEWRQKLQGAIVTIAVPLDAAHEALGREISRTRPAREVKEKGVGARDAAIWLSVLGHLQEAKEDGYFVTNNSKDFSDGSDPEKLHPDLVAEVAERGVNLTYCASFDRLLQHLAVTTEVAITIDTLRQETVRTTVVDGLRSAVMSAVTPADRPLRGALAGRHVGLLLSIMSIDENRFVGMSSPRSVEPTWVSGAKAYEEDARVLAICWSKWRAEFDENPIFAEVGVGGARVAAVDFSVHLALRLTDNVASSAEAIAITIDALDWAEG